MVNFEGALVHLGSKSGVVNRIQDAVSEKVFAVQCIAHKLVLHVLCHHRQFGKELLIFRYRWHLYPIFIPYLE